MYICTPKNTECRVGQSVKTPPFHGGMTSSTLVRGTKEQSSFRMGAFFMDSGLTTEMTWSSY
jgi:hypothetical protein